jgi:streptogramin lyase
VGLASWLTPMSATASPAPEASKPQAVQTVFAVDGQPERIAAGPDGNLWFVVSGNSAGNDLARITPSGTITYFDLGAVTLGWLVVGPDGKLWATTGTGVAEIPTADPTTLTVHDITGFANPQGITVGPDRNLWAAGGDTLYRVPPAAPASATSVNVTGAQLRQVTATSNRVWAADSNGNVHAVTTGGDIDTVVTGGQPQGITAGPNGQVFVTVPDGADTFVGRLTLGGTMQKTPFPTTDPAFGVTYGPDGNYWFGLLGSREPLALSPAGQLTRAGTFPMPYGPRYVTTGPGNTIWASLQDPGNDGAIGRVTGLDVDKTATIKVKGSRAKVKNGKATIKLQCPKAEANGPCAGKVRLKALSGKNRALGSKAYSVKAGKTRGLKVKLGKAALDRIGPDGLKVKVVVTVRDTAGNKGKVVKKIKLVR